VEKKRADSSEQKTGISGRHGFGCAVFVFQRGLNAEGAEVGAPFGFAPGQVEDGKKRKKRRARWKILSEVEVEVLQPSPVNATGVPTPDLVGWLPSCGGQAG
jgi:hypothetical protein